VAENRLPFGDPLAHDGSLHGRIEDLVVDLVKMGITLREAGAELERIYIQKTLRLCHGNRSQAARKLGIHRNTLNTKIEQYQIDGDGS
jgi:DNA-binding NtrC family response regulator